MPLKRHPHIHRRLNSSGSIAGLIWLFIIGLVAVGIVFEYQYVSKDRPRAIAEIKSGVAGYCIDDYHDQTKPGAIVDSWPCNGTASQNWIFNDQTIAHGADCLTLQTNHTDSSAQIVANKCGTSPDQIWVSAIGGYENPASALCLDVPNNKTEVQLRAESCQYLTTADELWQTSTWSKSTTDSAVTISCASGTEGQQIACNAAKQYVAWRAPGSNHENLLNTYSDGNGYEEWCADFVSYIFNVSGYPFSQGERDGWDEYLAPNVINMGGFSYHPAGTYVPKPGDVAYFDYNGGHVEIVAIGGTKPVFIYGDSGTTDPATGNGEMTENTITYDGSEGQLMYYLSPS